MAKLASEPRVSVSAVVIWETTRGVLKSIKLDVLEAREDVHAYLRRLDARMIPIGAAEESAAVEAYARFGKGRHPAQLNMGDCFAYACARTQGAKLLFKGDDFALTDIEPA